MTFGNAVRSCLGKYANFSGRAARCEFWWFWLLCFVAPFFGNFTYFFILGTSASEAATKGLRPGDLLAFMLLLPLVAVAARRMHDIGWSGWWVALPAASLLLPEIILGVDPSYSPEDNTFAGLSVASALVTQLIALSGVLFFLALTLRKSQPGPNRYGPNPLEVTP